MSEESRTPDPDLQIDIGQVVASVRDLGERARFLTVNLAVAMAKLKQMQLGGARLNEELLDLMAKVTRVSHDVSDAVAAIDEGVARTRPQSQQLLNAVETIGVPDERSLDRLTQSLNDTLDLARDVLRWARQLPPPTSGGRIESQRGRMPDPLTND